MNMLFIDVILPVPLHLQYTYRVKEDLYGKAQIGNRVIVQFGKKRIYTGLIYKVYESETVDASLIKDAIDILDDTPIVNKYQLKLWEWISSYYLCSLGDVYRAAIPTSLKLESETYITLNKQQVEEDEYVSLSTNEFTIVDFLIRQNSNKSIKISELEKISAVKNILPLITSLQKKAYILIEETLEEDYKDKEQDIIMWYKDFSEVELNLILDNLKRSPKQYQVVIDFIASEKKRVTKKEFTDVTGASLSIIKELVSKNIIRIDKEKIYRQSFDDIQLSPLKKLSEEQEIALVEVQDSFHTHNITLLHGVTGSGKTEIYIHLIKEAIKQDKQTLYLLPEIALTKQITDRLKKVFGNDLAVYHSRFNDKERAETWMKLKNKECKVVLGARSAVFLPFSDLGLIIVDEEHETSYKQQDPSPRYNAKNTALILANIHGAKTLLGSATPSIETYYACSQDKYGLVKLVNRYNNNALPQVVIEDTKELRRKKIMKHILSPDLIKAIKTTIANERQVILFQNRRGFAPYIECATCGWTPRCTKCDVSLTFHKNARMLVCHYCGGITRQPNACPNCEGVKLEAVGYGTERIEQEVKEIIPEARISRMDLDTTRGKHSYEKIIDDFEANKTNVLVGTQMVTKGLDFGKVDIVGVINANNLLNYPNFRAYEKAFQMLTQVSGRAGRQDNNGKVYIQTSDAENVVFDYLQKNDLKNFYESQLAERSMFNYPPYCRLIEIVIRSKDEKLLDESCIYYTSLLKNQFGNRVLGPSRPPVSRVQLLYIRKLLLKIELNANVQKVREVLLSTEQIFLQNFKGILIHYDVDPF